MSFSLTGFKTSLVPKQGFEPIPKGKYPAIVQNIEPFETKAKGVCLKTTFQIISGEYAQRLIFFNINVKHQNERPQNIGLAMLHRLATALGYAEAEDAGDVDNFVGKPLQIGVIIKEETEGEYAGTLVNSITDIKPLASKPETTAGKQTVKSSELEDEQEPQKNPWE